MKTTTILNVPELKMSNLEARIEKVNKRCRKLGFEELQMKVVSQQYEEQKIYVWEYGILKDKVVNLLMNQVEIIGEIPSIKGWTIVAKSEILEENSTLIYKVVEGSTIPEKYETGNSCEHCNSKRQRKHLYILQHVETGEYIRVGKTCLKDFLETTPSALLWFYECIGDLFEEKLDKEEYFTFRSIPASFKVREAIEASILQVKKDGHYISRNTADYEGINSTVDSVKGTLQSDEDIKQTDKAKEILNWIQGLKVTVEENQFLFNARTLSNLEYVSERQLGMIVALVPSYRRHLNNLKREEEKRKEQKSEYVGNIKERKNFTLKIVNIRGFDGLYGYTNIYKFKDKNGNVFVWFTGNSIGEEIIDSRGRHDYKCAEIGDTIKLKGTIKEHSEYDEIKQTVLTRCKVSEIIEG